MRYTSSSTNEQRNFFEKSEVFWQKNEGVILDDGNFVGPKIAYVYAVLLERERFLYLLSVLRNMSYEGEKNFRNFFCSLFCPKTPKMKKN